MTDPATTTIKNVRLLDNTEAFQLFPIEITYIENGQTFVYLTSAAEFLKLHKAESERRKQEKNHEE